MSGERATCRHCGFWIQRDGDSPWYHVTGGFVPCFANTDAAPEQS